MRSPLKVVVVAVTCFALAMAAGCTTLRPVSRTGFLSDYSRLEPVSAESLRYLDMARLGTYSKFIIDPVVVHLHGEDGPDAETRTELANYMHNAIANTIGGKYMIVSQPAAGVARLRVAITDIDKSKPALNVLPQTKLTGMGIGGASMEAELVDSQTGEQIGALIESKKGSRLSLAGMTRWGDAKAAMDEWAERFEQRLDEAHGRK